MTGTLASVTFPALGTTVSVLVTEPRAIPAARQAVEHELAEMDAAASRFRPDSELSRLNGAGGARVQVGPLLVTALTVALRAARLTEGDVDPTVGRALRLSGYDRDFAEVDRDGPALVEAPAPAAGWQAVELDPAEGWARVPAGVEVDLGATAKALAVDRAVAAAHVAAAHVAADCGVLVSVGGDLAVCGSPPPDGWAVRVTDDHRDGSGCGQTITVVDGGLATSSTTVRRWSRGGHDVHHIVDPRTGEPPRGPWRTVSVTARSCVDANTASTAAVVRGATAVPWLGELGLPARLVSEDGRVVTVGGWPDPQGAS
ncbi:MAG TPA: FAD:protein FMN transferase [Acidimicrobiales bacterium]|nr:FAD:protein FMN transferase [Acidimicrobiales bacterium]